MSPRSNATSCVRQPASAASRQMRRIDAPAPRWPSESHAPRAARFLAAPGVSPVPRVRDRVLRGSSATEINQIAGRPPTLDVFAWQQQGIGVVRDTAAAQGHRHVISCLGKPLCGIVLRMVGMSIGVGEGGNPLLSPPFQHGLARPQLPKGPLGVMSRTLAWVMV